MPPKPTTPPSVAKPPYPVAKPAAKPTVPPATATKPAPKVPFVPLKESMARRLGK